MPHRQLLPRWSQWALGLGLLPPAATVCALAVPAAHGLAWALGPTVAHDLLCLCLDRAARTGLATAHTVWERWLWVVVQWLRRLASMLVK